MFWRTPFGWLSVNLRTRDSGLKHGFKTAVKLCQWQHNVFYPPDFLLSCTPGYSPATKCGGFRCACKSKIMFGFIPNIKCCNPFTKECHTRLYQTVLISKYSLLTMKCHFLDCDLCLLGQCKNDLSPLHLGVDNIFVDHDTFQHFRLINGATRNLQLYTKPLCCHKSFIIYKH